MTSLEQNVKTLQDAFEYFKTDSKTPTGELLARSAQRDTFMYALVGAIQAVCPANDFKGCVETAMEFVKRSYPRHQ